MKKFLAVTICFVLGAACSSDDALNTDAPDAFDREAMLVHWADNIIVPAYQAYAVQLTGLQSATTAFTDAPETTTLAALRTAWFDAYRAWQSVAMFEIGKAEELSLRNYTNIYPTDAEKIEKIFVKRTSR